MSKYIDSFAHFTRMYPAHTRLIVGGVAEKKEVLPLNKRHSATSQRNDAYSKQMPVFKGQLFISVSKTLYKQILAKLVPDILFNIFDFCPVFISTHIEGQVDSAKGRSSIFGEHLWRP